MTGPGDALRPAAGGPADRIWTVSELGSASRALLEAAYPDIWVEGELSNFHAQAASGHWYFTLKDDRAQVAAAMFRSDNRRLRFRPADGLRVLARGRLSLFEARGTYQLIVAHLEPRGAGALHLAFEQLRARLAAEGLFDPGRKRALPFLPRRLGIVTSADGAALRDILRVLRDRHAGLALLIVPTRVQGEGAAAEIAAAIERAGRQSGLDALIVGRGGGSLEDLWAFNEEVVARAIAACPVPVVSAVGHEVDVTIADLVADLRAPTPSAAAEMVVARQDDLLDRVAALGRRVATGMRLSLARRRAGLGVTFGDRGAGALARRHRREEQRLDDAVLRIGRALTRRLARCRRRADSVAARLSPAALAGLFVARRRRSLEIGARLRRAAGLGVQRRSDRLAAVLRRLDALSPLAVLERGYALARVAGTGAVVTDARLVAVGTDLDLVLHRGRLLVRVRAQGDAGPFPPVGIPGGPR